MFQVKSQLGFINERFATYAAAVEYLVLVVDGMICERGKVIFNGETILTRTRLAA